jgi:RNA polymerase sigma-70 factor (ECF subfamily)
MKLSTPPSDAELLRLMAAGDEEAFTTLYRRRQAGVYRFALQMSGSEAVAEDVTQEVFMVLMRDADHYDPERGSLAAYLYGIARNLVLRSFQKDRPLVALDHEGDGETDGGVHETLVARHDPLGDLTRGETVARVRQAVLALPGHYREVVVLCELHELSYAEAAQTLGLAVGTVRSRLHRGRAILIEKLRATSGETGAAPSTLNTARCFA